MKTSHEPKDLNTFAYFKVLKGDIMALKQISLTVPDALLEATKEYSEEFGYKNVQELILDLLRNKVLMQKLKRYQLVEEQMKAGKAKKFNQKDAVNYIKGL